MKKKERVQAALSGAELDRPPYGFWTHLPGIDLDAHRLAAETAAFCARYDLDFVKSMPNGFYCVEDWGCVCDYSDIERGGVARVVRPAIASAVDWAKLERVDVTKGSFGRELRHLELLIDQVTLEVPVLATVFSPLTIAAKLSNGAQRRHLMSDAQQVEQGLDVITEVTCNFVRESIKRGCAGIFLALQDANPAAYDESTYRRFGEAFDRRVLEAARVAGGWFNVLHMHGNDIMFDLLKHYEVTALNWHIGETSPSISDYRAAGGNKPILGGLVRDHITRRDHAALRDDIRRTMDATGGRGILLAPACVIRHPVDEHTLTAIADMIKTCTLTKGR